MLYIYIIQVVLFDSLYNQEEKNAELIASLIEMDIVYIEHITYNVYHSRYSYYTYRLNGTQFKYDRKKEEEEEEEKQ